MINVSQDTKNAFMSDVSNKTLRVVFPELNLTYYNNNIEVESLKLTESISSKDSVEFVGCIASNLEISIYNIQAEIKNRRILVYITCDNTEEIPLFNGIVDSVVIDSTKNYKKITAYDELYTKGNVELTEWYNSEFPTLESLKTIKELRDSLFDYVGLEQVKTELCNDDILIGKIFDPKTLKSSSVMKSICQFNGCCGIINRYGKFEYRYIKSISEGTFPAATLFPSSKTHPSVNNLAHTLAFYENLKFQEYYVKPMKRIQFRKDENDTGITVGAEIGNKYIIQSNMFAQGLDEIQLKSAAENILNKLKSTAFYPCETKNNGLPFVEVGDGIKYILASSRTGRYATSCFIVLTRTLSGIQLLKDNFSASGNEEQSEFITDLQTQIDTIKMNGASGDTYTKEEIDTKLEDYASLEELSYEVTEQVSQMEVPTGFNIVSCYELPAPRQANTLYLVQGMVIML